MLDNSSIGCLLAGIAQKNQKALEELWHETKEGIYSFILTFLDDRHLAEDVLQETFIAIYKGASGFKRNTNARAWIFTIAKNTAVSMLRKRKESIIAGDEMAAIPDGNMMESIVNDRDEINRLLTAMDEISRRIIIMHAVNDLKHSEIASILGLPLGTVYRRYSLGMKKLKVLHLKACPGGVSE